MEPLSLPTLEIDKNDPTPIYLQIADTLRRRIRSGGIATGLALPPERVLCRHFGVSRMTLREAYGELEQEGLIECQQGRGTFVAASRVRKQQQEMRSFTEEILARGSTPGSRVLLFRVARPDKAARDFFTLPEAEPVYEVRRVRSVDDVPLALETVILPCYLCPNLDRFNLATQSLYRILEEHYGLKLSYCIEEISAILPSAMQRKLLAMPRKAALLMVKRKTYTSSDTPLELGSTAFRGDRHSSLVRSVRAR